MMNKLMHVTSAFQQNKFVIHIVPDPSSPCEGAGTRLVLHMLNTFSVYYTGLVCIKHDGSVCEPTVVKVHSVCHIL